MNRPRFFCEHVTTGDMTLPADEARHAVGSRRLRVGEEIVLFDGTGPQWPATISRIERRGREVFVAVGKPEDVNVEPAVAVTVATALPKGRRWHWLIEKCTELGTDAILALACQRSIVKPESGHEDVWRKVCISAAKQCGRNRLPDLAAPMPLKTVLANWKGGPILIGEAEGDPFAAIASRITTPKRVLLLIGPEGGFTDSERQAALTAGAAPVRLGPTTLRTETAAVALLSACLALWS